MLRRWIMTTTDRKWFWGMMRQGVPPPPEKSVVKWAEEHVRLKGSARSERFQCDITPWLRVPIECLDDGYTRSVTYVKPIQSGGSVVGEIALCRWISCWTNGDLQYNWEDDDKADARWKKRTEPILTKCQPVKARWPSKGVGERSKAVVGMVNFPHLNLTSQGVFTSKNLDSDSIRGQVNEEMHNWKPGMKAKADGRLTAFWNSIQVNISNAGMVGDQLHRAYEQGTKELYQAWCPGCRKFHFMQTKWDDKKPQLGGLRYDADGCRLDNGDYNYLKMLSTIRYQMPCGFEVRDTPGERRLIALQGRYSEPTNQGATMFHRSFNYDGIVVDYIPFLNFIKDKHEALRAKRAGDIEPFKRYVQERECRFWNPEEAMDYAPIDITSGVRKSRTGWPDADGRCATIDRQQGRQAAGEVPHYWVLIEDWKNTGDNLVLYEGMVVTEPELISLLVAYEVPHKNVLIDSGWDTEHVYGLCVKYGWKALKGDKAKHYEVEVKRGGKMVKERRLWMRSAGLIDVKVMQDGKSFHTKIYLIFYSKNGLLDRLQWLEGEGAGHIKSVIPEDVSEDYHKHCQNMTRVKRGSDVDGLPNFNWEKVNPKGRNDLKMCRAYQVLFAVMNGFLGIQIEEEKNESA